jgi:hypothetical protein
MVLTLSEEEGHAKAMFPAAVMLLPGHASWDCGQDVGERHAPIATKTTSNTGTWDWERRIFLGRTGPLTE